jgi:hypothetical protein
MAAGSTYTPIANYTATGSQANYTFSSIPSTYTDLILVMSGTASSNGYNQVQFNSDTGLNYSQTYLYGDGSTAGSGRNSNIAYINTGYNTTGTINATNLHIMNYSNATTYKTALTRDSSSGIQSAAFVGLWRNTAAITSIKITAQSGNYTNGYTMTLYGVKSA